MQRLLFGGLSHLDGLLDLLVDHNEFPLDSHSVVDDCVLHMVLRNLRRVQRIYIFPQPSCSLGYSLNTLRKILHQFLWCLVSFIARTGDDPVTVGA